VFFLALTLRIYEEKGPKSGTSAGVAVCVAVCCSVCCSEEKEPKS